MRYLPLLCLIFISFSCSKDKFDSSDPKNGQTTELFVDHFYSTDNNNIYLWSDRNPSPLSLREFLDREIGYTYKVKAKVYVPDVAPQDGPDKWFVLEQVLSKEKYTGKDPFEISLQIHSVLARGLAFRKLDGKFIYSGSYELKPMNQDIAGQMEQILSLAEKLHNNGEYSAKARVRALVTHDPENPDKGYIVQQLLTANL
ncbi:hypothetical protein [Pedobacter antarcticus]|uniref:hypothetical protein n=1 Tax=Pedobacter antarcticus TaxID=34086 RepID=UPI00292D14DB|nr:hypothetical protein [Pedobacter antarcticus]